MALIVKCNNGIVTDEYLETIGHALEKAGHQVAYTNNIKDALKRSKTEIIVVARSVEAYNLILHGFREIIVWFQGIEPEESYMAHKSKIRYYVLGYMEKQILKKARFKVFVSNAMKHHYEAKYKLNFDSSSMYIMPCQNTLLHTEAFESKDKYSRNIFVYTGSMAVWQKFEDTVKAYKQIEDVGLVDCELWVFTSEKEEAERILEKYMIKKYKIDYVDNNKLPYALANAKYGFIIREDTAVNRVATPTKISTYLSCGLIPIYSKCIVDFDSVASHMKYAIRYDENFQNVIQEMALKKINNDDIYKEYKGVFDTYYNNELHTINMSKQIKDVFHNY
ncbi:hypothetical protein [Ruminococcus flavefaciens]|uniref:hypothetical protein n=1 Tax=Ruminococcus flavefaciens TaxID=1265 RepID=UPI0002EB37FC|nr:hypothetical protein [Ruminococcus flavefaciens]